MWRQLRKQIPLPSVDMCSLIIESTAFDLSVCHQFNTRRVTWHKSQKKRSLWSNTLTWTNICGFVQDVKNHIGYIFIESWIIILSVTRSSNARLALSIFGGAKNSTQHESCWVDVKRLSLIPRPPPSRDYFDPGELSSDQTRATTEADPKVSFHLHNWSNH